MANYSKSKAAFKQAVNIMPGGVNSPVRANKSVDAPPVYMESGSGAYLKDIDGNSYIDYVLSWGPLIAGHANKEVIDAITTAAIKGTSFGTPTEIETELAKLVIERVPSIEMIRMVSSGTEATMSAIRLARGYTKRDKILKFEGSYHGHGDSLLIKAGSGVATLGLPDSPGVTKNLAADTITVPYNDLEGVQLAFEKYGEEIAAIIVEPVAGNMGVVPPIAGFLEGLRKVTTKYGALLIFDEVMTGFRVDYYSAQGYYVVTPDITCLGKVIGGGLPVGAYGGKKEIMEQIAPSGPIYQAGTLSGNPLAMNAGFATLKQLKASHYDIFRSLINRMEDGLHLLSEQYEVPVHVNKAGSMFGFFFTDEKVINFETAKTSNLEFFRHYYREMLDQGIFLPPSQFEGIFISTAHTEKEIDKTLNAVENTFKRLKNN